MVTVTSAIGERKAGGTQDVIRRKFLSGDQRYAMFPIKGNAKNPYIRIKCN